MIERTQSSSPVERTPRRRCSGDDGAALVEFAIGGWADRNSILVAIETSQGPVVETLLGMGLRVYAINPKQEDRLRDRFSPAGAKDDRRDAFVLASCVETDGYAFREVRAEDLAGVVRVDWTPFEGGLIGGSFYGGGMDQGRSNFEDDTQIALWELHAQYRWEGLELRALYAQALIDGQRWADALAVLLPLLDRDASDVERHRLADQLVA